MITESIGNSSFALSRSAGLPQTDIMWLKCETGGRICVNDLRLLEQQQQQQQKNKKRVLQVVNSVVLLSSLQFMIENNKKYH